MVYLEQRIIEIIKFLTMENQTALPPKPITRIIHSDIARLPRLTMSRRVIRRCLWILARLLTALLTRSKKSGQENIPSSGGVLVVSNHLGDADIVVGLASSKRLSDFIGKIELLDYPILGLLLEAYGFIWIHRGLPDRKALRAAIQGLKEGRMISVAPEGRESLTGGLEEATHGAAYLALKSGVPIMPVTLTGTQNKNVFGQLRRFHRPLVTVTIGPIFQLQEFPEWHETLEKGTRRIMVTLANQLPREYRGVYQHYCDEVPVD